MSADHFKKRADLLTASLCVVCYFGLTLLCAIGIWFPQVDAPNAVVICITGTISLSLSGGFLRRADRLMRELEQENLDEILRPKPWEEVKLELANLHKLHGKN